MAHKSGRQLFEMDVREVRTNSQDDAMEGYNFDGPEFWQEFYESSFVCAKNSLARVQLTL